MAHGDDSRGGIDTEPDDSEERTRLRASLSSSVIRDVDGGATGVGTDLGVGGIYVVTPGDFEVGRLVELEFELEGTDRLFRLLGEVRWSQNQPVGADDRFGIGIEFVDVESTDRGALESFVERHEPLESVDRSGEPGRDDPAEGPGNDRGHGVRVATSIDVTIRPVARFSAPLDSRSAADGLVLVTPEKYSVGTPVDVVFGLGPLERRIRVRGTVQWRRPAPNAPDHRYGIDVESLRLVDAAPGTDGAPRSDDRRSSTNR